MVLGTDHKLDAWLRSFDFEHLFVNGLGWDFYRTKSITIVVDGHRYLVDSIAEKAGYAAYVCKSDGDIPPPPIRSKIERQVTKRNFEHILIFIDREQTEQVWQWVRRTIDNRDAHRTYTYSKAQTGTLLLQKLDHFLFTLDDELKGIKLEDVGDAVRRAFDVEKITKRFYERFKTELAAFQKFIDGIPSQDKREWYASIMLNRMMFVYFIQKQKFLDWDKDYLRNRMRMVQEKYGSGNFQQFYRDFLLKLFHDGLSKPESKRNLGLRDLLGNVPYLNGGLFDVHELERDYPEISIPDEAFEKIFNFFDAYNWHLDERPRRDDNEINPDVLGYIFEKYINQKQLGAYYTKNDVTYYITRNTVIPFIFDSVKKKIPDGFNPGGNIWKLLQDDPDRYIYPAVRHGVTCTYLQNTDPQILERPFDLPDEIAVGVNDVSKRNDWNTLAPDQYALPTETWREVVARRQHYQNVKDRLSNGTIFEINDLVTFNLDIERFALDVITASEGPEMLRVFWKCINSVSVLDPTCGSGAFLFAALNTLESLYDGCLVAMRVFVDDMERTKNTCNPQTLAEFTEVLDRASEHPNQRYFILKSIILNNLYGVDIMDEAVEICKLRLFLKLVAQLENYGQIEPLPDIDFNIRAGNTLVGYTSLGALQKAIQVSSDGQLRFLSKNDQIILKRINKAAEIAGTYFDKFRSQQSIYNKTLLSDKTKLRVHLDALRDELDAYLAAEYKISNTDSLAYKNWKIIHKPFHWFIEFYGILNQGGFDVIIGNPPYLEFNQVNYDLQEYGCLDSKAIHALCMERSSELVNNLGCLSMIVPLALPSTIRMKVVQDMLEAKGHNVWYANFAWRPAKLFDEVNRALTIFITSPSVNSQSFSTSYQKWASECRDYLFSLIIYGQIARNRPFFWAPKINTTLDASIFSKILSIPTSVKDFRGKTDHRIFYRSSGGLYWKVFTDFAPKFSVNGVSGNSTKEDNFSVQYKRQIKPLIAVLSSNTFWWWYTVTSNLRDMSPANIMDFPIPESVFSDTSLSKLGQKYLKDIAKHSSTLVRQQKSTGRTETQSFKIKNSKHVIDEIDRALATHYNFTENEIDFIINYDIKYRMSIQ